MTTCGEVIAAPPLVRVTLTLEVPKAERGARAELPPPNVSADMVTVDAPIE